MAKKSKRVQPVQNVGVGADPYQKNNSFGRNLGKMMGAVCLLAFICFDQLWIATSVCALAFAVLFVIQVFVEKSRTVFASLYLYAAIGTALLAFAEFRYQVITNLLGL